MIITGLCFLFLAANTLAFAEDVNVTANGTKFHKADCRFIKDKKSESIDKQEAIKQGYEPCQKCIKEDQASKDNSASSEKVTKSKKKKVQKDS
jgi:hypothetical protein